MAILHFSGPAGIWLQSVKKKLIGICWESFTALLCTIFGRDKHQMLIRQFYVIKQLTSIADFIERFETLIHHFITYSELAHASLLFLDSIYQGASTGYTSGGTTGTSTGFGHNLFIGLTPGRSG